MSENPDRPSVASDLVGNMVGRKLKEHLALFAGVPGDIQALSQQSLGRLTGQRYDAPTFFPTSGQMMERLGLPQPQPWAKPAEQQPGLLWSSLPEMSLMLRGAPLPSMQGGDLPAGVSPLSPQELASDFEQAWPVLERSLALYPFQSCGKIHLWTQIESDALRLWRDGNSFMVTSARKTADDLKILDIHLAGGELPTVVAMEREMCALARSSAFHGIQITGRRGWLRAFDGYQDAGTLMGKMLQP